MNATIGKKRSVVIVYGPEHPDWQKAIENAPLKDPFEVRSFLDSPDNKELPELVEAIRHADAVVLQISRAVIEGSAVKLAQLAVIADPVGDKDVLYFNDDYSEYVEPEGQIVTPFNNEPYVGKQGNKEK